MAVVVKGVRQQEVVVGEERGGALLAVELGERLPPGPRGKGARGIAGVAQVGGADVDGGRHGAHGAV